MVTLLASGAVGALLGYALRLYGETFRGDRCGYLRSSDRCGLRDGHHGPHKIGGWGMPIYWHAREDDK